MSSAARLLEHLHHFRRHSGDSAPEERPEGAIRVRRALFGPVDHDENRRFVERELARNRREASDRWNYDFERDAPREGRYVWEPLHVKRRLNADDDCNKSDENKCDTEESSPNDAGKPDAETATAAAAPTTATIPSTTSSLSRASSRTQCQRKITGEN